MKITRLHVDGFGKLHDVTMELSGGVNLLIGPNEAGKTTLHLFLRSMFYGADTKKQKGWSIYDRMRPWQQPECYGGSLEVREDPEPVSTGTASDNAEMSADAEKPGNVASGRLYKITRNFHLAPDDLKVEVREEENQEWKLVEERAEAEQILKGLLKGLSETAYVNTVSAGQLSAATERDMAGELRKYAANLTTTVHPELNADRAMEYLAKQRQKLAESTHPDASRDYTRLLGSIKKAESALEKPENANQLLYLEEQRRSLRAQTEEKRRELSDSAEKIELLEIRLKEGGVDSAADIARLEQSFHEKYDRYRELETKSGGYVRWLGPLLSGAGALAILAGLMGRTSVVPGLSPAVLPAAGAAIVIAGIAMIFRRRKDLETCGQLSGELKDMISEYTEARDPDLSAAGLFEESMTKLKGIAEDLAAEQKTRESLNAGMQQLNTDQADCIDRLEQQRQVNTQVENQLQELKEMRAKAALIRRQIEEDRQIREDMDALDLAVEKLEQLKGIIGSAAGTYLNEEASRMVAGLTNGAYHSLDAGRNMEVLLNSADGMISLRDVSAGTSDQVYLALRLAATRFIAGEEDAVPLLLDDSFALYDDERLQKSMSFLADNYRGQILIFTCQNREAAALEEEGIPYHRLHL